MNDTYIGLSGHRVSEVRSSYHVDFSSDIVVFALYKDETLISSFYL